MTTMQVSETVTKTQTKMVTQTKTTHNADGTTKTETVQVPKTETIEQIVLRMVNVPDAPALPFGDAYQKAPPGIVADAALEAAGTEDPWAIAAEIIAEFPNVQINMGGPSLLGLIAPVAWKPEELRALQESLRLVRDACGSDAAFRQAFPTLTFARINNPFYMPPGTAASVHPLWPNTVFLGPNNSYDWNVYALVHEMGHVLDANNGGRAQLLAATNGTCNVQIAQHCLGGYDEGGDTTDYGETNPAEDFAESFAVYVFDENGRATPLGQKIDDVRANVIDGILHPAP